MNATNSQTSTEGGFRTVIRCEPGYSASSAAPQAAHCSASGGSPAANPPATRRNIIARVLAFIGYVLSPLCPYDDALVNGPLAAAVGFLVARFYPPAFEPAIAVAYFGTNIIGVFMLRKWGPEAFGHTSAKPYSKRRLIADMCIAGAYSAVVSVLVKLGVFHAAFTFLEHLTVHAGIIPAV